LVTEFIVPEDHGRAIANIGRMSERDLDRSLRSPDEYRAVRADGSTFDVEVMGEFIRDAAGQPTGMVFDVRDVSERKEAEAERHRLEEKLVQAQKLEAVGQLAGGIAHDFNNMLGVILASAELAAMSLDRSDPARNDIAEIRGAAERAADLTRQLLGFARRQVIAPRHQDLNETVGPMLNMLRRLIGEDIDLIWKPGPQPCPVFIDPGQVDQILANLVVNARDAISSGGGTISIATATVDVDRARLRTTPDAVAGSYAVLSVVDDGCGMDRETRARIFEPFFTTKPMWQGTGLGLATVYGIAHQNHGFVEVETEPGKGTEIRVLVPLQASAPSDPVRTVVVADSPGNTETVLLVEDEPVLLRLTVRMLESLGYTVLASDHPGRALELAAGHRGTIDLLVSDMMMPGMDGVELWKRLSSLRPGLRCLFISGYPADVLAESGVLAGRLDLLQKPFSRDVLAARLRLALAQN